MNSTCPEVLIIEAGPAGLFAAAELARHGVKARILDQASPGSWPPSCGAAGALSCSTPTNRNAKWWPARAPPPSKGSSPDNSPLGPEALAGRAE
ncbi:MAG: FAD-dependent monooxygenase [Chthoniobacterales bacterium]